MDDKNQSVPQPNAAPQAHPSTGHSTVSGSTTLSGSPPKGSDRIGSGQPVATSVSVPQKEQQPVPSEVSEFVKPSEAEPVIHPELSEVGVEKVKEVPDLTLEDKKAGLEPASESVPVSTAPSGLIQLPITEEEALHTIKTTKASDSRHWLAVLVEKVFQVLKYGSGK